MGALISADQENEQWFVVTSEIVAEAYSIDTNSLKLNNLNLIVVPNVCDLLDTDEHMNVRNLDLSNNKIRIVDQDLSCLINLKSLNLSYNEIEIVKDLWILPNLNQLKLQKNNIDNTLWLPDFPALESLNLWFNNLTTTLWLERYTNLESLELYHNQIQEVVWLENLEKLEQLKVEFNNIKDFEFVDTLKQQGLELMTAKWNEVKDWFLEELREMNNAYLDQLKDENLFGSSTIEISVWDEVSVD